MSGTGKYKRSLGLQLKGEGQGTVRVWAPLLQEVKLELEGKAPIGLQKDGEGYWTAEAAVLKEGDRYKFMLDNGPSFPDPASLYQPEGVHGFSEVVDLDSFTWTDGAWTNPELSSYIIYELHTGCFSPRNDFRGIEEKLDHLVELGVNAIEIMPVAQFPGSRNWGYDGVFPFAVQNSYGGPRGLQQLVNACHNKGIAVILDVVYNHLGPEGNYLGAYGPYFTDKYKTPWGSAINFDDQWCDGVRRYFIENALMWLRDFHIDALRLDAVHAIKDLSPVHILQEIRMEVNQLMEETGRKHYLIVELDLNDNRFINPLDKGGYGMDAQWVDEFHHALRVTAGGDRHGYYEDFTGIGHLAKSYRDAYVYDGQYSAHRKKRFGVPASGNGGQQFIVFSQNHDQVGNRMLGERTSQLVSFEMQKLLAGAVMVSPFLPMLFMGEEWSEPHPFQYFVSHTDPELAEAVRKGRKAEFAAFHAQGEAPDPVSEATFRNSLLQWELKGREPHRTQLRYYQELIRIRRTHPALRNPDRHQLEVDVQDESGLVILHRWHQEDHLVCLLNFSKEEQRRPLPSFAPQWYCLLDSASPVYGGPREAPGTAGGPGTDQGVAIQPESILIYSNRKSADA